MEKETNCAWILLIREDHSERELIGVTGGAVEKEEARFWIVGLGSDFVSCEHDGEMSAVGFRGG